MKVIIWFKGIVAFGVPFFTAMGIALAPYALKDSTSPNYVGWLIIICAPMVAGFSGLGSFLSTSFSDHKAQLAQDAVNANAGLPAGLPVVVPPAQVSPKPLVQEPTIQ
jgi:hypothetical protein